MKKQPVTVHISGLNGLRKDQDPDFNFLNGATTTNPDATYGCVKSTILVRFVTMAISPMAASKNCNRNTRKSDNGEKHIPCKLEFQTIKL